MSTPPPHLRWTEKATLKAPILLAAFEGWNDAGEASSTAVRYLRDHFEARPVATIDAEDFFDFTVARPMVQLDHQEKRTIKWPSTVVSVAEVAGSTHDLVTLIGHEPQLRWRTFADQVFEAAQALGAVQIITLGSLLVDVPHTRPVQIYGSSDDQELAQRLAISPSAYQGPTGIVGVLASRLREHGIPTASFWAGVPAYVSNAPSPKAALALVNRVCQAFDTSFTCTDLEISAAAYERQVSDIVAEDESTATYVEQLEEDFDAQEQDFQDDPDRLVSEVEDFLRDQNGRP
ncbi:MAG: PAC2 family protein [Acidimicrobiales bacterium]